MKTNTFKGHIKIDQVILMYFWIHDRAIFSLEELISWTAWIGITIGMYPGLQKTSNSSYKIAIDTFYRGPSIRQLFNVVHCTIWDHRAACRWDTELCCFGGSEPKCGNNVFAVKPSENKNKWRQTNPKLSTCSGRQKHIVLCVLLAKAPPRVHSLRHDREGKKRTRRTASPTTGTWMA